MEMSRLERVSFVCLELVLGDLHEEAIEAETDDRVVAVFSLDEDDDVEGQDGQRGNELEDVGEEHGPWCQRLGSELRHFVDGGDEADQGEADVDRLPSGRRLVRYWRRYR